MLEALRALSRQYEVVREDERSDFYNLSRRSFDEALTQLREELDQQVVLMLTASAEALLKQDYAVRLAHPSRTPVNERFRRLDANYGEKVPLDEILDVWKEEAKVPDEAGALKQIVRRRHWLAHGRYWTDKSGVQPAPRHAICAIQEFIRVVKQSHPDFPRR